MVRRRLRPCIILFDALCLLPALISGEAEVRAAYDALDVRGADLPNSPETIGIMMDGTIKGVDYLITGTSRATGEKLAPLTDIAGVTVTETWPVDWLNNPPEDTGV